MIRAKFRVISVTRDIYNAKARTIKLSPQYDQAIPEDRRFAEATPTGELTMYVNNPSVVEQFEVGRYFYLDFTPV